MIIKNVYLNNEKCDIRVHNGFIEEIEKNIGYGDSFIDANGLVAVPSFIDMHTHLREPGFTHKETILTGSYAALNGGFSDILCMPNTRPVLDNADLINWVKNQSAFINVHPVGAVTVSEKGEILTDFESLRSAGAVALSDDGMPVEDDSLMEQALIRADKLGMLIISHCEVKNLVKSKIDIPPEAEYKMVERDIRLAKKTGAGIHIAHVSTKESVNMIRQAKKEGVKITCETCPHYFSLTKEFVKIKGSNAVMNPPLRESSDVESIIEGLKDGTIDVIVTDHAPHSPEEKNVSPEYAPFGIIGLETSFSVGYTYLVRTGILSMDELINLMSFRPFDILGIERNLIKKGCKANFILINPNEEYIFMADRGYSKSVNTPYDKMTLFGRVKYNIVNGVVNKCQQAVL